MFEFTTQRYEQRSVTDVVHVNEEVDKKFMMNKKMRKSVASDVNIIKFDNFSQMIISFVLLTLIFLRVDYQNFQNNTTSFYKIFENVYVIKVAFFKLLACFRKREFEYTRDLRKNENDRIRDEKNDEKNWIRDEDEKNEVVVICILYWNQ